MACVFQKGITLLHSNQHETLSKTPAKLSLTATFRYPLGGYLEPMELMLAPTHGTKPAPVRLTRKYQPTAIDQLILPANSGKNFASVFRFLKQPYSDAFLFCGKSGIGKTSLAMIMAGVATNHSDYGLLHLVGPDLDSNRARLLEFELLNRPLLSLMWVVVIDEADAIPAGGQVRLLKILQSLPEHAVMIFTSNEDVA